MENQVEDGTLSGYPTPTTPGYITYLRVKIKSLAKEAAIIRREENATRFDSVRRGLHEHRVGIVRNEARWSLLAYGFLRGLEYWEMEPYGSKTPVRFDRVLNLAERYSLFPGQSEYTRTPEDIQEFRDAFKRWESRAVESLSNPHPVWLKRKKIPFIYKPTPEDERKREERARLRGENYVPQYASSTNRDSRLGWFSWMALGAVLMGSPSKSAMAADQVPVAPVAPVAPAVPSSEYRIEPAPEPTRVTIESDYSKSSSYETPAYESYSSPSTGSSGSSSGVV